MKDSERFWGWLSTVLTEMDISSVHSQNIPDLRLKLLGVVGRRVYTKASYTGRVTTGVDLGGYLSVESLAKNNERHS